MCQKHRLAMYQKSVILFYLHTNLGYQKFLHGLGSRKWHHQLRDYNRRTKARCRTVPNPRMGAHMLFTKIVLRMPRGGDQKKLATHDHKQTAPLQLKNDSSLILIMKSLPRSPTSAGIFYNPGWYCHGFTIGLINPPISIPLRVTHTHATRHDE